MRRRALEELDGNTWVASRRSNRPRVARVGVLTPINAVDARDENSSPADDERSKNKAALARAMEICLEKNKDSPHRCDEGHVTLQEALDSAGYTGSHGCPTLLSKTGQGEGI